MTEANASEKAPQPGKGKAFFQRAEQVAGSGNWDFAIEMYIEGIRREPDNVQRGHQPLREVALKRKAQGGKGPGMVEQFKRRPGKEPLENLVNAEYLLSKDPGSVAHMEHVLKAAKALGLSDTLTWIGGLVLQVQKQAPKADKRLLVSVAEALGGVEDYRQAVSALDLAIKLDPEDGRLRQMLAKFAAEDTIKQGRYDEGGDFTKSVRDMEKQKELMEQDSMHQDEAHLRQQLQKARQEYKDSPNVPGKVDALVDALVKMRDTRYETEAIQILRKAHEEIGAYRLKTRIGDIQMNQMTRRYRELVAAGKKQDAVKQLQAQLAFELEEYAERVANYPTDMSLRYELGRRQYVAAKYDDAIASLQQAQREPRRRIAAMNYLGQAFAKKGWAREAAETFQRALEAEVSEERTKELRYNLGCALEQMGQLQEAQDEFSKVAQLDYNYKDVRDRLEAIRRKRSDQQPPSS